MSVYRTRKDGVREVAVLYSPGYGAGWYSWNQQFPTCLTDEDIVALVQRNANAAEIAELATAKWGADFYTGGANLKIEWVEFDQQYRIDEYDGAESIVCVNQDEWQVAR